MEQFSSSTPFSHEHKSALTGIRATNTKDGDLLELEVESVPKINESSVRINVPARANLKKRNTCGSLYAKCKCNQHSLISGVGCDLETDQTWSENNLSHRKSESFSHPDPTIIFNEENRYSSLVGFEIPKLSSPKKLLENGKEFVKVIHSKRLSSSGRDENVSIVHIHPEFKVQVVKPLIQRETPSSRRRPVLKKNSRSFPSTTRTFSSSYEESEEFEDLPGLPTEPDGLTSFPNFSTTVAEVYQDSASERLPNSPKTLEKNTAEKFFLVRISFNDVYVNGYLNSKEFRNNEQKV